MNGQKTRGGEKMAKGMIEAERRHESGSDHIY